MYARRNFTKKGKIVLHGAVPEDVTDHLRSKARDTINFRIHETWDSVLHDDCRYRVFVPDVTARALSEDLQRFYLTFFPNSIINEWQILTTTPEANDQLVRRDFEPVTSAEDRQNDCSVPGSLYISLYDNTGLYGYGWNNAVAMRSDRELIRLKKGDINMLRGDYMYARVGYRFNHACVHGRIDTPFYLRPAYHPPDIVTVVDDTVLVDDLFCFVWNCPFRATGMTSLRKHVNRFHGMFVTNAHSHDS